MMGRSPCCYIPSFVKIGPPVLEKIFEGFLPYKGMVAILSCDQHHVIRFSFPCTFQAFIQNLVQNGPVVSEKIRFEFLYVHYLGPRSSNDLDLQYPHTFMKSISCLFLPTFRSKASIVSEKSTVFTFCYRKA